MVAKGDVGALVVQHPGLVRQHGGLTNFDAVQKHVNARAGGTGAGAVDDQALVAGDEVAAAHPCVGADAHDLWIATQCLDLQRLLRGFDNAVARGVHQGGVQGVVAHG